MARSLISRNPHEDPETVWLSIESYATHNLDGLPITVIKGDRHRGGKGSAPAQHPQYWIQDGATPADVAAARAEAGILS